MIRYTLPKRRFLWLILGVGLCTLIGCEDAEIKNYKAPKPIEAEVKLPPIDVQANPTSIILGAVIPDDFRDFYVKVSGPIATITQHEAEFDALLGSIKIEAGKVTATPPPNWKPGKGTQFSELAYQFGPESDPVELTVSRAAGGILLNLNRWRGQLGLKPIFPQQIPQITREVTISGRAAYRVDLRGTLDKNASMGGPMVPTTPMTPMTPPSVPTGSKRMLGAIIPEGTSNWYIKVTGPADLLEQHAAEFEAFIRSFKFAQADKPTWTVPNGWKPSRGNQFSVAAFQFGPEATPLELTVSLVGGSALENLNRWRGQLDLPSITESELPKNSTELTIDGRKAIRVDLKK